MANSPIDRWRKLGPTVCALTVPIGDVVGLLAGETTHPERIDVVWFPHTGPNPRRQAAGAKLLLGPGVVLIECAIQR